MKLITLCIPIYNEQENIKNTILKIDKLFNELRDYTYEIIFSDNNSNDNSESILKNICNNNNKVKYIRFEKNLGYDFSVFYNIICSSGDASIVIDCDLQDPLDKIKDFLKNWERGYDLIYGIRVRKNEEDFFFLFRKYYYIILNRFSKRKYPLYAGDFRLIDRSIINNFKLENNDIIITRCISFDYSKKEYGIPYNRMPREFGYSKYPFLKSIKYALNTFLLKTNFFEVLLSLSSIVLLFLAIIFQGSYPITQNLFLISFLLYMIYIVLKKIIIKFHLNKKKKIKVKYKLNF